ncbi:hypothetical protein D5N88_26320 [Salmonella enterica subsp. enterica serovar Panama]|nr:hypothetical protein [Salmonella enterica subsp. enterica serovar Panama]
MKDKFSLSSVKVISGFEHLRSDYSKRQFESFHKMYRDACILFDRGHFHDALLCFCFIRDEIGKIIPSFDSFLNASLINLFARIEEFISECMHKLSNSGEKCYDE